MRRAWRRPRPTGSSRPSSTAGSSRWRRTRAGLPARTTHTITTLEGLRAEIAEVRRLGYALDREENVPGVACVAAPIRDATHTITYGLSISTLTLEHTLEQIEAMSIMAVETGARISAALGLTP